MSKVILGFVILFMIIMAMLLLFIVLFGTALLIFSEKEGKKRQESLQKSLGSDV